jgi:ABC-2 type transport system ATP-binding protein
VGVSRVDLSSSDSGAIAVLPSVVQHESADGREMFTVTDADAFVRELVGSGADFRALTVRGATLEEAFLALTEASAPGLGPAAASLRKDVA